MTDEQIDQAIAKLINCAGHGNYCSNLNSIHEAEKIIFPYHATVYSNKLARVTGAEMSDDTDYFCATARQRAEAFLRALGKWEEATDNESLMIQPTTEDSSVDQKEGQP